MSAFTYHDLRLVRMNRTDDSLHCTVHGLLNGDETEEVVARMGMSVGTIRATDAHSQTIFGNLLTRIFDLWARLQGPKCRTVFDE